MKKILTLMFLLLAVTCQAQEDLVKVRINDFSGGMSSNVLADLLQPNQGASLCNVMLNRPGRLETRGGQALFVVDTGSTAFTGVGRFDPDPNTSYMIIASGVSIARALSSSTSWTVVNPSTNLTTGKNTEFIQANDLFFILNGNDATSWYNGNTFTQASSPAATYSSPPTATTGAWLRNYLFLAGNPDEPDWVYYSNNLDPTTFTASDIFKINTGDGQKIQRIVPFRLNELIVYKERSIFVLDITGATPGTDWTIQPLSKFVGCIAPRSVVIMGNDQWFLSSDPIAIRSLARTEYDKILTNMVSGPIQDIFDGTGIVSINKNQISKAAGVLFDNKYFLAIPVGDSTVNNFVVVYDFVMNAWYTIKGWYPADWVVFNNNLYYADALDGKMVKCLYGTTGDFAKGPTAETTPSSPIEFTYISRVLDFDHPENLKQLDALEVEFDPTGDYDVDVFINLDYDGWQKVGTVDVAGNSLTLPVTLPAVLSNGGVAREIFDLESYGEFRKMQVMVQHRATSQKCILQRLSVFARVKPWRRDE